MRWMSLLAVVAACSLAPASARPGDGAGEITVFAAASLQNALESAASSYRHKTGRAIRFSFAATSALARQIEQGAPAAVFASADEQWMDFLQARGLIATDSRKSLLGNRLVLVVPASSIARVDLGRGLDLGALLGADGR